MQALPALPESVCIVEFSFAGEDTENNKMKLTPEEQLKMGGATIEAHIDLILHIGLAGDATSRYLFIRGD
mgnify:CR=1 FL=1